METIPAAIAAIHAGDAAKLQSLLAEDPSLSTARDANGVSLVMQALYYRHPDMAKSLAHSNSRLDIFEASSLGAADAVKRLVQQDPSLTSAWSADGFTALQLAAFFAQEATARILIEHGADLQCHSKNAMQVAPLHAAAAGRSVPIVALLLEHGANPDARQQKGFTALHSAAQNGDRPMVETLLKHGADPALTNEDGKSAAQFARAGGHAEVAALLEKHS